MKMITQAIAKKIPALYATDGQEEKKVAVKFFTPWTNYTWYAVEGEKAEDGDWEFFGYTENGQVGEWGYFRLSDLTSIKGPFGLKVERDMYFDDYKINMEGEVA